MLDRRRREPLVSVVVCTKNGMPHVRDAVASLEQQTYRRFEVVVQDAASADGTREFLETVPFEGLDVVSEPDQLPAQVPDVDALTAAVRLAPVGQQCDPHPHPLFSSPDGAGGLAGCVGHAVPDELERVPILDYALVA